MQVLVGLVLSLLAVQTLCSCPHTATGLTRWSTWAGRAMVDGDNVTIDAGTNILLDVSPAVQIQAINVYGQLIFNDVDLTLNVGYLLMYKGGSLFLGSEDCPLTAQITITLFGQKQISDIPLFRANKVLGAYSGGSIDIHGTPRLPTWTVLAKTANVGDTSIVVDSNVQWKAGDLIVLASTDFTHRDSTSIITANDPTNSGNDFFEERRTITSVTAGAQSVIYFDEPLRYMHWGEMWQANDGTGNFLDNRGEVGMLTRNIVVRGDITQGTAATDRWGGHIMMEGPSCSFRVEGAELYYMGQKDNFARYPIHVHLCGDTSNSYAKRNAIYDTFQRAITIHGTNYFLVQQNVAFNVSGHMYFIEDGNEHDNVLDSNLGIRANPHSLLITADATPAIFWITNAANTWTNNVAAGGHFGFWFALPDHPTGLAAGPASALNFNRKVPVQVFQGNKAHGCTIKCLHFDDGLETSAGQTESYSYYPVNWQLYVDNTEAVTLENMAAQWGGENMLEQTMYALPQAYTTIKDFTAYKCIEHAIWGRGSRIHIVNAKIADSQIGAQFPGDGSVFEDSIIVGETDNVGTPTLLEYEQGRSRFYRWGPDVPIIGYRGYDFGGPNIIKNVVMYNFQDFHFQFNGKVRKAGGIGIQGGHGVLTPRHKYYNVGFVNSPNHVYLSPSDPNGLYEGWEPNTVSAVIIDSDGSVTGKCGSEVVYPTPMLAESNCVLYDKWNAYVCPPGNKPHRWFALTDQDNQGGGTQFYGSTNEVVNQSAVTLYRLSDHASFQLMSSLSNPYLVNGVSTVDTARKDMYTNILVNTAYFVQYGSNNQPPSHVDIKFGHSSKGEWLRFAIPYPAGTTFTFNGDGWTNVTSIDQLAFLKYFFDTKTNLLWIHMENTKENYRYDVGYWTLDNNVEVSFTASCSPCYQYANPLSVSMPDGPNPTLPTTCEAGGNRLGGNLQASVDTSSQWVIFDETLDTEWNVPSWITNWEISQDMASSGSSSLKITLNQNSFYLQRVNALKSFPADKYTHFTFKIRSIKGRSVIDVGCQFADKTGAGLDGNYFGGSLNDPRFKSGGPVDDTQWHSMYIPLENLGLGSGSNLYNELWQFSFWPENWEYINSTFYIDELKFARVSTSYAAENNPSNNINTNYDYNTAYAADSSSTASNQNGSAASSSNWAGGVVAVLVIIIVALIIGIVVIMWKKHNETF